MNIVLFGRGETKKTNPYDQKSLLTIVDAVKGNLKLSPLAVTALELGDKYISLAQAEIPVDKVDFKGNPITKEKVFYIYLSDEKNGFKVAKNGSSNSRYYSRELSNYFAEGRLTNIVLDVETTPTVIAEYPEIKFYKISLSSMDMVEEAIKTEVDNAIKEAINLEDVEAMKALEESNDIMEASSIVDETNVSN